MLKANYDQGILKGQIFSDGRAEVYSFDSLGRPQTVTRGKAGVAGSSSQTIQWSQTGELKSISGTVNGQTTTLSVESPDKAGRVTNWVLTSSDIRDSSHATGLFLDYDANNNLSYEKGSAGSVFYTWSNVSTR